MGIQRFLRSATRGFRRERLATTATIFVLALGIGTCTATYAVFDWALFRPVSGVDRPDRLVTIQREASKGNVRTLGRSFSHDELRAMRTATLLAGVSTHLQSSVDVVHTRGALPRSTNVVAVSAGYFDVLGARAARGRLFTSEEYEAPGQMVAVVSERFWQTELGGRPDVIGHTIALNVKFGRGRIGGDGHAVTIVGVVDRYQGWSETRTQGVDIWFPVGVWPALTGRPQLPEPGGVIARLKPNATVAAVQAEIHALVDGSDDFVARVWAGPSGFGGARVEYLQRLYSFFVGGQAVLLALACVNVAGLLLARLARRREETGVQVALGARPWHLVREPLAETLLIAGMATVTGTAIAAVLTVLLRGTQLAAWLPAIDRIEFDGRVIAFAAGMGILAVAVARVLPAWLYARVAVLHRGPSRLHRAQMTLLVGQISLSVALLGIAGVLTVSLLNLKHRDVGADPAGVVVAVKQESVSFLPTLPLSVLDVVARGPGVTHAALASAAPFQDLGTLRVKRSEGGEDIAIAFSRTVSCGYFEVLRIAIRAGRVFTAQECGGSEAPDLVPAVISETLARQVFGSDSALGRSFIAGRTVSQHALTLGISAPAPVRYMVIGVAADVLSSHWELQRGMIYAPADATFHAQAVLVRSTLPAPVALGHLRSQITAIDRVTAQTSQFLSADALIDEILVDERLTAHVALWIGLLAGVITFVGVSAGAAAYVAERRRELAIRMALGASQGRITGHVLGRGAVVYAVGVGAGLLLYGGAVALLRARVYGLSPFDPSIALAVVAGLALVGLLAMLPHLLTAARVDPGQTLKAE